MEGQNHSQSQQTAAGCSLSSDLLSHSGSWSKITTLPIQVQVRSYLIIWDTCWPWPRWTVLPWIQTHILQTTYMHYHAAIKSKLARARGDQISALSHEQQAGGCREWDSVPSQRQRIRLVTSLGSLLPALWLLLQYWATVSVRCMPSAVNERQCGC